MKWASAVSENPSLEKAVQECVQGVKRGLDGAPADFACAFISMNFAGDYEQAGVSIRRALHPRVFTGCSAGGVIGGGRELEQRPGVSLVAASLPGVSLRTFYVQDEDIPDLDGPPRAWETVVGV